MSVTAWVSARCPTTPRSPSPTTRADMRIIEATSGAAGARYSTVSAQVGRIATWRSRELRRPRSRLTAVLNRRSDL